jgi:hypothetical protein
MFLLNGEIFISPNHDVKNINLINESSSKRLFIESHFEGESGTSYLIIFYILFHFAF